MQAALTALLLAAGLPPDLALPERELRPPRIPPAEIDNALEVTGEALKAREADTRLTIDVALNGKGPFRFLVDSGADRTVVGRNLAAQLALEAGPNVRVVTMADSSDVQTVRVASLGMGRSSVDGLTAPALAEEHLGAQGILGIDALAEQRVSLDFDARRITIQNRRVPIVSDPDEIVVVARRRNGQLIITRAAAAGNPVYAIIDTGSEITLGNSALRQRIFGSRRPLKAVPIEITAVSGQKITADLVVLPEVQVGDITLTDVPIAFADVPPFALFGLERQPSMLLGTDLLRAFKRVSLDFAARRVRFQVRRR
jgi:predicted aspartyl protease